jgi:AcrR family transcriptional regulator
VAGPPELREKLVLAATSEVERLGIEAVSLRTLAKAAGVSRQAPYLCFADKRALLAAVAAEATRNAREAWGPALARTGGDPRAKLCGIAMAHARYAASHPELYELMYGSYVRKADDADLQRQAAEAFRILRDLVEQVQPSQVPVVELRRRTMVLWGAVHGLVDLHVKRQVPASIEGALENLVETAIATICDGWAARTDAPSASRSPRSNRKRKR